MIDRQWANAAIKSCLDREIDHFFVAPGSRCTPLTLAVARHEQVKVTQHFDERGLAFAALGYGKATGKPAVFICTSGTAVANALPAVIEAAMEKVPLLLFTADRPDELHGVGANQAIAQQNIFGDHVELFLNMTAPQDNDLPQDPGGKEFLANSLGHCFNSAFTGPVHVNWMFREPFSITEKDSGSEGIDGFDGSSNLGSTRNDLPQTDSLQIEVTGNTLIALGRCNPAQARAAIALAKRLKCPIVSDLCSGLSIGSFELPSDFPLPRPDSILHLGSRIVSKSWLSWTKSVHDQGTQFFHLTPNGLIINPGGLNVNQHSLPLENLDEVISGPPTETEFLNAWQNANELRSKIIVEHLGKSNQLTEPAIAHSISRICQPTDGLFVGNSMPIRDLDRYSASRGDEVRLIAANRGASGIDGLLATATGYASGLKRPVTVLIGDLSSLHDLNSLALVSQSAWPMIIVIVNNHGGHIFDLLPIKSSPHFERYFNTPHQFRFEHAARMFNLDYKCIEDFETFEQQYKQACAGGKTTVLELLTSRQQNIKTRQTIREAIQKCQSQI